MAINFPTSLDTLSNPNTTDQLNSPSHAGQHSDINDAVEALEAKVGADSSAVESSHDYKLSTVTGSNKAETQANKRTSFQATPTDTAYPSEKLVKDSLDAKVDKSTFDANTVLKADTDNTPAALTVGEQTVVGRATGGNIAALSIDSDLSSVSANDDTIPSAKATKAALDGKMANPMTTAGDVIYGGASGTPTRLAKGTAGQVLTMNSGATAPEWANASGGGFTSVSVVTGSRAKDTVYQNTSGKTMMVIVSVSLGSGSGSGNYGGAIAKIGDTSTPATEVSKVRAENDQYVFKTYQNLTFIVPNNYYYTVASNNNNGSLTVNIWTEIT